MIHRRKPKDLWDDGESSPTAIRIGARNRRQVLEKLIRHALSSEMLDALLVAEWHKDCFIGLVSASDECFLGAYRGSRHPRLKNMRVIVGGVEGAPPLVVEAKVDEFFHQLRMRVASLLTEIPIEQDKSKRELRLIATLAGWAHGEWVRIHPFANGSGRTARLIANWVLARFRLLPVVGIRPRPEHPYGPAAIASMRGDHPKIARYIVALLEDTPR